MSLQVRISALASGVGGYLKTAVLPKLVPAGGSTGQVLAKTSSANHALNWVTPAAGGGGAAPVEPENPQFGYTSGSLTSVLYSDGTAKTLAYTSGKLSSIEIAKDGVTVRKDFTYNPDGTLASIAKT